MYVYKEKKPLIRRFELSKDAQRCYPIIVRRISTGIG